MGQPQPVHQEAVTLLDALGIMTGEVLDGNSVVGLALAGIAAILLINGIRRRQRERARGPAPQGPRQPPARSGRGAADAHLRDDLESLIGELQDLSRKIGAEIDTRFAKLEAALRDADRRIAVLHRLSAASGERPTASAGGDSQDQDVRYAVVYDLADAGASPVDIARELGKTPGEIELILNLRRTARQ